MMIYGRKRGEKRVVLGKRQDFFDVSVIVFEAYGTLFDINVPIRRYQNMLDDHLAEKLTELWYAKQTEYALLRNIMGHFVDFWHITGTALDYAMAHLSITDPVLRSCLMQAYLRLSPFPEVSQVLTAFRDSGIRTAILSNGSRPMLTAAVAEANLHNNLDAVLSADQSRMFKPAPSFYRIACEHFSIEPKQIVFVSTHGSDASGAANFGMRAIWINQKNLPSEQLPGEVELHIANLSSLCEFMLTS